MEELIPNLLLEQINGYEKNILDCFYYTSNNFKRLKFEEIHASITFDNGNQYDKSLKVELILPPLDYVYLREELLKNPFQMGSVEATYIFCLCKDARSKIHSYSLIEANSIIQHIQKVHETTHNIIKSGIEYTAISPYMAFYIDEKQTEQSTYQDKLYYLPHFKIHFLKYVLDSSPNVFDTKSTLITIRQEIQSILTDHYKQILYNKLNESVLENGTKWKSINFAAIRLENKMNEEISNLVKSNKELFQKGRQELIEYYIKMIERLNTEITDNAWVQKNKEALTNAQIKIDNLTQVLLIEKELLNKIDTLTFLNQKKYSAKTFKIWITKNISKPEWKKLFLK
ncbi:hypothetical protein F886_01556 [Acinetobacter sp. NIPH 542]|uniref:hypothetical protein n=1 Tax=Acinetobacter sp. NIPH 542 TaxID=1217688 RepID=UPI0002D13279|nr:hypothetical protein [Acinetobacter sp. NIPH 542]ENX46116.1 hypothetical protein F886_01556 [Acinetobacter sp. NIPH 542]